MIFAIVYALLAQNHTLAVSFGVAIAVWTVLAFAGGTVTWTLASAIILNIVVIAFSLWLSAPLRHAPMPRVQTRWYDLVLRATMVALLVAVFPIVLSSIMIILQSRRRTRDGGRDGECGDRARRFWRRGARA